MINLFYNDGVFEGGFLSVVVFELDVCFVVVNIVCCGWRMMVDLFREEVCFVCFVGLSF